jgi:hypothetical protein
MMKNPINRTSDNINRVDESYRLDNEPTTIQNINNHKREDEDEDEDEDDENIIAAIYRYKFTQDFMDELYKFSKVHQYDDRSAFKEAWQEWTIDEEELIEEEMTRLEELGYDGDILDKMFKSARYYFRKKSTVKPEPKPRRKYIGVHKELLENMDSHIARGLASEDYKPSDGFNNFCVNNVDSLKVEVGRLLENDIDSNEIMNKIKKTYKNRYFMLINK